ncbi:MAG: hypothetical protein A2Y48_02160 [Nitrospirae bacterium RIFCSPLOW2_12_42_9]|nr:MAG: hypothetical protein A2035_07355 [Nitrospirae bacterium GWA2_42_11]OGW54447.1 MAG: hypothetical protein A2Z60_02950 [Nitrospirae bacterium RIFCSPLOWO2_02_42_7]OGW57543.1 MAG: hypothetical protein A2Y48_02160 [Nitrospirae bacterium RIFCSPLOW2_12_42_9]OGW59476.1 MAG: hypothetical protein A3D21_01460 [Nitrospirae bacterium RIFCSPHIGHO2_02_FULL_42_12]
MVRYLLFLLLILAIILTSKLVKAEIYTFVDDNGTIHFTNVPTEPQYNMIIPPIEEKERLSNKEIGKDYNRLIEAKSYKYGLDPALVKAVIAVESDFNPRAVSRKGARGLMQLMPMTASELGVFNVFDPEDNIDGGTRYLKYLLDYFNWDIDLALAAYNAGLMRVKQHTGIPPFPETVNYVDKVKRVYRKYILQ